MRLPGADADFAVQRRLQRGVNPAFQVEQLTLSAVKGRATLATTAGLTFVSGNGTASVTVRGTINALNAAVNGLIFTPNTNTFGSAYLVVRLNDLANTAGPAQATPGPAEDARPAPGSTPGDSDGRNEPSKDAGHDRKRLANISRRTST